MFNLKNKISPNLQICMKNCIYGKYRVLIKCTSLLENMAKKIQRSKNEVLHIINDINCICAIVSPRYIERLTEYPEVSYITLDSYAMSLPLTKESVSLEEQNIYIRPLNVKNDFSLNGKGITVAFVSTGIYPNKDLTSPEYRIIKSVDLINKYTYTYDDNGMGTYLSGIIGGNGISSNSLIRGIAPRCNLYSVKAFDSNGKGFIGDILYGIQLVLNHALEYKIKVLLLPFEELSFDNFLLDLFQELFDKIVAAGVTIIAPAGSNRNTCNPILGMASLKNIITVGGLSSLHPPKLHEFSSIGVCRKKNKPDFLGPCNNMYTLNLNRNFIPEREGKATYPSYLHENYCKICCVSTACAYYGGICALLCEYCSEFAQKDILSLMKLASTQLEFEEGSIKYPIVYIKDLILPKLKN
ncbi:Subtilase family protein [Hathewaya proteolytica DSM 3090]|uniref:Subtilase family protein n=1 Tax=Hathewaya proteolytica DSM 3090 TaxID=1121331 RepID=A0A1M6MSZ0_9CLOT|nr:S8 family serine peptidase [Hathewaya proteolytica]SHJ86509.1 Subtilase family protein [Hathewaya proteolytica DSM 3090]